MKKLLLISFMLIFASSASATVYKWADEGGVMNFTDDYGKIPPDYRNKAKEVSMPKTGRSSPLPSPSWKHRSRRTVWGDGNSATPHCPDLDP